MKIEINDAIRASGKTIDEVFLFREMAKAFNHSEISKCTYVEEIHGPKGMVNFPSKYKVGGIAKVELGDLLLLTFDKATNQLRICILQAKYEKKKYSRFLDFKANLFQWELLLNKPDIIDKSSFNFPPNILNFRDDYYSITAYGIFYHNNVSGEVDFLYTLPRSIVPYSYPTKLYSTRRGIRKFKFHCPTAPDETCRMGFLKNETISTCCIDTFEKQVLSCRIGAPIDVTIYSYIISLLKHMKSGADDTTVIDELLYSLDSDNFRDNYIQTGFPEAYPSALIVITDSSYFRDDHNEMFW